MIAIETSPKLSLVPGIVHGFFGRQGGVSLGHLASLNCSLKVGDDADTVAENRRLVLSALGLPGRNLAVPNLVHSDRVVLLDDMKVPADTIDADGIIATSNAVLGVTYADCLPVLMASCDGRVIAAVHAGWRGIMAEILINACFILKERYGIQKPVAALGPVISPQTFLVRDEVLHGFSRKWPQFVRAQDDQGLVDLRGIAYQQLLDAGVTDIDIVGGHTDRDEERYFSHRRDHGHTGRHIAIIARH